MDFDDTQQQADDHSPGPFCSEAMITLHTRVAYSLFAGWPQDGDKIRNKGYSVDNLKRFGTTMNAICAAARNNDPFADWWLYRIERKMEKAEKLISAEKAKLDGKIECFDKAKIESGHSVTPINIQLRFANPFAYQAAYLLVDFDNLAGIALDARNVGAVDKEYSRLAIHAQTKRIRKLFLMASGWKPSRVTRDTYDPASPDTRKAEAAMGSLPQDFLDGKLRAKIAPDIRTAKDTA